MNDSIPEVKVTGVDGYVERSMDFDVNGKWGGKRAVIVRFKKNDNPRDDLLYLYMLVSDYWSVGKWLHDPSDEPSKWGVVQKLVELMDQGVNRRVLYDAITNVVQEEDTERVTMPETFYHELTSIYGHVICTCGEKFHYSDVGERLCPSCDKPYVVRVDVNPPVDETDTRPIDKILSEISDVLVGLHRDLLKKNFTREEAFVLVSRFFDFQLESL